MERQYRPFTFNLWLGRYAKEFCPVCAQRACVTQDKDYDETLVPRCEKTLETEEFHCSEVGCCHGCQCARDACCPDDCRCDCHYEAPKKLEPVKPQACQCYACVNRLDCPVQTLTNGQRVTRRPRDCLRFAALGSDVFSTHYNNEDGRNRSIDSYFRRPAQMQIIVIEDDEEDTQ